MRSTMQDGTLSITSILKYGSTTFPKSKVTTYLGDGGITYSYEDTAKRVA
ncbi:MAG: hypothetical protein HKL84_10375, partial [Acidimicrobiaceae bacterium]|nr:hypothetical protein [Acidimicrobiaceae bacterium]